jgi:DNA processing protein
MPRAPEHVSDATLRLLLADGLGPVTLRRLRERFGNNDERIAEAPIAALDDVEGIGRDLATSIRRAIDSADIDTERKAMRERGAELILLDDADYPPLLKAIADAPAALWLRGALDPQRDRLSMAIVGSRKCTAYGREQAGRFASLLAQSGLTIVSGGALGVDGEAHRAALRVGGRTIVVAGCGLSTHYPPEHADLFERIVTEQRGTLVSEFPMRTPPAAGNFPRRNRIISALSLGVLVIEAAQRSGALITARLAAEDHHREAMALPGRVDSPASAGCLKAIREGWAALVTSHADVLEQLDASDQLVRGALEAAGMPDARSVATLFDGNLTPGQQAIVAALREAGNGEILIAEQIAARTQLPLQQIMADITLLQIRGRVIRDWSGKVRLKAGGTG